MRKTFWNKRIPSLLGLLFLAMSVGIVSWFGKNYTQLRSKASVGETPGNVQISNITDTSFTVSYTTEESVIGVISYGRDSKLGQAGLDNRDREAGKSSPRQLHYIIITQLDPGTKYYFTILSGTMEFRNNNQPYDVTTVGKPLEGSPSTTSITGSVNLSDGSIPVDGIVYLSTSTSQLLSVLLKIDGTYLLSVNSLRTSDLTNNITLESDTLLQMVIRNASSQSHVSVKAGNANPVPLVTLSKDYDFTIDTSLASFTASESAVASPSGALTPVAPSSSFPLFSEKVANMADILTPKEAEKFTDQQPLFQGTAAVPNATVVINIDSTLGLQNSVKADNFGNWQFRPSTPLIPGQHIITIQTLDASGIKKTIKRSFTVLAEGSQFTEPSVSPTGPTPTVSTSPVPSPTTPVSTSPGPTAIPTSLPTATSTPVPTSAPTIVPTPASQSTITPVITIIPTSRPTSPPITPPGSSSLLIGSFLAVLSLTAGFMLFFFL